MSEASTAGLPIEISGLTKHFGSIHAVDDLSFTVQPGKVTGFLGPNGSGKTTTLRMLLGLVAPTAGRATIGGHLYRELPNPATEVGAVLEATSFHPSRRARAHLRTVARACGQDDKHVDAALDLVGLHDDAKRKVGGFSLGMRQRLELAGALIGDPKVLILDEPSNGLDPQGIAWLRDFMRYYAGEGKTVLVSSHLLSEMAQTIDEVVIVSQGRLRAQGTLESITDNLTGSTMRIRTPEGDRLATVLADASLGFTRLASDQVAVHQVTPEQLGPLLAQHQIVLYELVHEGTDLESVFLSLTEGMGFGDQGAPS
ncbi:MAG TPA: ATP-binding cassette domain-containing protein [Acidimicrobiales bacterium]|jgi:ABC-2 type transport system ATP-binding protein